MNIEKVVNIGIGIACSIHPDQDEINDYFDLIDGYENLRVILYDSEDNAEYPMALSAIPYMGNKSAGFASFRRAA